MSSQPADRALRKAVLRLKMLPVQDFDAVIAGLGDGHRNRTLALLAELEGEDESAQAAQFAKVQVEANFEPVLLPDDLSPWLKARVNGKGEDGEESADQFDITRHAHLALRRCAAELVPQPEKPVTRISLFDRLWEKFE
jgi:hypothetical protein